MKRFIETCLVLLGLGTIFGALALHSVSATGTSVSDGQPLNVGIHIGWAWDGPQQRPSTRIWASNAAPGKIDASRRPEIKLLPVFHPIDGPRTQGGADIAKTAHRLIGAPTPKTEPANASKALEGQVATLEQGALRAEQNQRKKRASLAHKRLDEIAQLEMEFEGRLHHYEERIRKIQHQAALHDALRRAEADAFETRHVSDTHLDNERSNALRDQLLIKIFSENGADGYARLNAIRNFRFSQTRLRSLLPKDIAAFGGVRFWLDFFAPETPPSDQPIKPKEQRRKRRR